MCVPFISLELDRIIYQYLHSYGKVVIALYYDAVLLSSISLDKIGIETINIVVLG